MATCTLTVGDEAARIIVAEADIPNIGRTDSMFDHEPTTIPVHQYRFGVEAVAHVRIQVGVVDLTAAGSLRFYGDERKPSRHADVAYDELDRWTDLGDDQWSDSIQNCPTL